MGNEIDRPVLVAVKTPMLSAPTAIVLSRQLTVGQALDQVCQSPSPNGNGMRVADQLKREMSGRHDILLISPSGSARKVESSQRLGDVAAAREIRTEAGVEEIATVSLEVQQYAPVGG
jgi:hypothetical protein